MPEVILPCPACGSRECESVVCTISADEHQSLHYNVECDGCYASGPVLDRESDAIAAWNSLPRALRWTHEPPKVAGWYWRKETVADRAHVFHFTGNWEDYGEHWESDRVCQLPLNLNGNLWAGPISPPID